ncbi:MAG: Mur ligase family protein [Patescibacteria group bacterium]|jgi:UDP-N-acetylmuramyl pentapeptide synthase
MKKLVQKIIAGVAKRQLAKFKPTVIAVTGSVGKTSTRSAIAIALEAKYRVRSPMKNYNNEFGLPLAILGEKSPGKDAWGWFKLWKRAVTMKEMPEYLVLEYGADKPGDISYLASIAKPDIAVITAISSVHLSNYPAIEALIEEKASLGDAVKRDGLVLLNANDEVVSLLSSRYSEARVEMYGIDAGDVRAENVRIETKLEESFDPGETFAIMRATLKTKTDEMEIALKNCVSMGAMSAAVAAVAVATKLGVPLSDAVRALEKGMLPINGRLNPLPGIKGALVLDDSYNAAPASVSVALDALMRFTPGEERDRRIAVLGDMAELGPRTESEHRAVGAHVARACDLFIAVGPGMGLAAEAAIAAGLPKDKVERFSTSVEAGRYLDANIQKGDVVLIKGSQSMRMEKAVKDIMGEPLKAPELLVRQEEYWLNS